MIVLTKTTVTFRIPDDYKKREILQDKIEGTISINNGVITCQII